MRFRRLVPLAAYAGFALALGACAGEDPGTDTAVVVPEATPVPVPVTTDTMAVDTGLRDTMMRRDTARRTP